MFVVITVVNVNVVVVTGIELEEDQPVALFPKKVYAGASGCCC